MQVTFSKRRVGLFKKCSELCSLCGAEIAIITFSVAGKLFSFGHHSIDSVIHRYLNHSSNHGSNSYPNHALQKNTEIPTDFFSKSIGKKSPMDFFGDNPPYYEYPQHEYYKEVLRQIDAEKKEGSNGSDPRGGFWWNKPIDDLGLIELEKFKVALEGLRNQIASRVDEINPNTMIFNNNVVVTQNYDFGFMDHNDFDFPWMDHGVPMALDSVGQYPSSSF